MPNKPKQEPMPNKPKQEKNQGEGNRDAARRYNEGAQKFAKSGKVEKAAEEARKALEGPEGEQLRKAEREGKKHAAN